MKATTRNTRAAIVLLCLTIPVLAVQAATPLPTWIVKAITDRTAAKSRDSVEERLYEGKRAFIINRGDMADSGDEHALYDESGKLICSFGGFGGQVTRGACDFHNAKYVRTLYSGKSE